MSYLVFSPKHPLSNKSTLEFLVETIQSIHQYHQTEESGRQEDTPHLDQVLRHDSLRKYSENRLLVISNKMTNIIRHLIPLPEYNGLVNECQVGRFFVSLVKQQYSLTKRAIATNLEDIHLIDQYSAEASLRLQIFGDILDSDNLPLKSVLLQTGFIQTMCSYINDSDQMDLQCKAGQLEFLPFRQLLPFKSEVLGMVTQLVLGRERNRQLSNEFLISISEYQLIQTQVALLHNSNPLLLLSALYFFSLFVYLDDLELLHLLKTERVFAIIQTKFQLQPRLATQFPLLSRVLGSLQQKV